MKTRRSAILLMAAMMAPLIIAQTEPNHSPAPAGVAAADIVGKWQFVFQTDGGPRTYEADLKADGKEISGTWDKKAAVKGTLVDGKLDLEFPVTSEEVGDGTLRITGRLKDALTGSWSFQDYSGTFKATRANS